MRFTISIGDRIYTVRSEYELRAFCAWALARGQAA